MQEQSQPESKSKWAELSGYRRWRAILNHHCQSRSSTLNVLKRVDGEIKLLLLRHPKFQRKRSETMVKSIAKRVLSHGPMTDMRGAPVGVITDDPEVFLMIAGAHFCEGIQLAAQIDPENEYVLEVLSNGIDGIIVLKADTHPEDLDWIKSEHNKYHNGLSATFLEGYELATKAENGFKIYKTQNSISVKTCPKVGDFRYEKIYDSWVRTNYGYFETWTHFDDMKAGKHKMEAIQLWSWYEDAVTSRCLFLLQGIKSTVVASINNQLLVTVVMGFQDCIEMWILKMVVQQALEKALPMLSEDGITELLEDWIYRTAEDAKKIIWMKAPMGTSIVYKKLGAIKAKRPAPNPVSQATPMKKKKKTNVLALVPPDNECSICEPVANEEVLMVDETSAVATTRREKMWLDDLIGCLLSFEGPGRETFGFDCNPWLHLHRSLFLWSEASVFFVGSFTRSGADSAGLCEMQA